jgi:hypothetical protein
VAPRRGTTRGEGDDVLVAPRDLHAEPHEQAEHVLDVADARDVAQHDLLLGQEGGGEDRQRSVLVSGGSERAG